MNIRVPAVIRCRIAIPYGQGERAISQVLAVEGAVVPGLAKSLAAPWRIHFSGDLDPLDVGTGGAIIHPGSTLGSNPVKCW
jgi:hypothetical protein